MEPIDFPDSEVRRAAIDSNEKTEYSRYAAAVEEAKKKGCIIEVPKPNELFIDIDSTSALAIFEANIGRVSEIVPLTYEQSASPSGASGRYHIRVKLLTRTVDLKERILLQALLGSDLKRELLSWQRAERGDPVPTLFFERAR